MASILRFIRGLNPLGPIFTKELRSTARRKRTYFLRFGYLGILLLVLLFFHLITSERERWVASASIAARAQHNAELGQIFFAVFSFFSLGMMGLAGPVLTSTAVNSERLHKTLPVLLMTPITSWQILGGKLFSRLLIAFTLLGLSLPALAVVRLLGGVEIDQIAASLSICVTTVIFSATVGLFFSTLMNRAYAVIILAYGTCALLWLVLPAAIGMAYAATGAARRGPPMGLLEYMSLTTPWFSMAMTVIPDAPRFRTIEWYWGCVFHLALSFIMLFWSGMILRRMARKEADSSGPAPAAPALVAPPPLPAAVYEGPEPFPANPPPPPAYAPPMARIAPPARDIGVNPVLWREVRRPLVTKRWQKVLSVIVVVGLVLLFYVLLGNMDSYRTGSVLREADSQIGFAFIFCGLLTILTCIVSATAIAAEKESDTWTLLLATPLSAGQIVRGKFAGILRRLMWPAILIVAHFLVFMVVGVIHPGAFVVVVSLTLGTNLLFAATGLYLSLRLKTVTFTVILNLLVPITLYLITLLIVGILVALTDPHGRLAEAPGLLSPYAYMGVAIEKLDNARYEYYRQQGISYGSAIEQRQPWLPSYGTVTWEEFTLGVVLVLAGHVAIAWLILTATIRSFNRIVGRASQTTVLPVTPPAALGMT